MTDTIFALASGAGRSAIAVVRLSGPGSGAALERLAGRPLAPRRATVTALHHPATGELIDRGVVLWFPGPASFTGEDAAEFQVHGSRAVVVALLDSLAHLPGCRLAEPGEFARRAFSHGKLDLAALEGLADLIDAQTGAQRQQALHQLDGALGRWIGGLRATLVDATALVVSAIDFVDESDVAADTLAQARAAAADAAAQIRAEQSAGRAAERVRNGFTVALAGPPNAGKSTLLNTLARRDVALVSPIPGTTRDAIEVMLELGGYAVTLVDTAGLRDTVDPLEQAGMDRARDRAARADLVLWLQEASTRPLLPQPHAFKAVLTVGTKVDVVEALPESFDLLVAAPSGLGMETLLDRLEAAVAQASVGGETAVVTRARHQAALAAVLHYLNGASDPARDVELVAEDLRSASEALGTIVGAIETEEVLGAVFARFCIGK